MTAQPQPQEELGEKRGLRALFYLALASPGLIPIVAPYLPFQDWPAHLGVIGALVHYREPAARIPELYELIGWVRPNSGFYAIAYALAAVFPPLFASNLAFALALGGLGPAVAHLCRSAGADERLAFFALPLAIGRHVYCGFVPNAAALVPAMLAVSLYLRLRASPRLGLATWLAVCLILTEQLHFFVFLAVAGLLLLAIALDLPFSASRRGALSGAAAVVLSFAGFVPQLAMSGGRTAIGGGALSAIWSGILSTDRSGVLKSFWEWLFASYRYAKLDDVLQASWLALLAAALALGVWRGRGELVRGARGRLLAMAVVALAMFAILPSYIGPPLNWWGGNLRLPVIAMLLLVPCGVAPRMLARGAAALCLGIVLVATADLARFSYGEMAGFREIVDAIPPGRRVSLLHYTPQEVHEYPGEPHGYASNYYLLLAGGFVPQNVFENPDVPFSRKAQGPAPPWGMAEGFDWHRHGAGYDAFVLRKHPRVEHAPLHGENQTRVELVKSAGNWSLYLPRGSATKR